LEQRHAALAQRQHGLATRGQLSAIGMSDSRIEYRLRSEAIYRVYESVYRLASHPVTWRQRLLAACWAGGDQRQAVVSHRAAAALLTLPGGSELAEITSPRHLRARHQGVITHESLILEDRDVHYVDEIPVTRPARTLCDLASLVVARELERSTLELAMVKPCVSTGSIRTCCDCSGSASVGSSDPVGD